MAAIFEQLLGLNGLRGGWFCEPYAGGAGVGLSLLLEGHVEHLVLNDLDRSIYAFWHSVLHATEELCYLIEQTPLTMSSWEEAKAIQREKATQALLPLGFSTLFLNRTNRSGILDAGPIGGKKQAGAWTLDSRFPRQTLVERIRVIAARRDRIHLYSEDASEFVYSRVPGLPGNTFFFFDPPYFKQGQGLYTEAHKPGEHALLAKCLKSLAGRHWCLTYDDSAEIRALYSGSRYFPFSLQYSLAEVKAGRELLICGEQLAVPQLLARLGPHSSVERRSRKRGRPRKPCTKQVEVRLDVRLHEALRSFADSLQIGKSAAVESMLLERLSRGSSTSIFWGVKNRKELGFRLPGAPCPAWETEPIPRGSKRGRGRPAKPYVKEVKFRINPELCISLEAWARRAQTSKSRIVARTLGEFFSRSGVAGRCLGQLSLF